MKKPFVFLWTAFAGILLFSWVYLPSLSKYHDLKQQQDELDKQIEKLSKDVEIIREERNLLKNDPEYLEKVIRDELGLVKPGEIIYKFVQDQPEDKSAAEEMPEEEEPAVLPAASAEPSPEGITVAAKPVAPKTAAGIVPRAPIKKPAASPLPKKSLPPAEAEPVYPRRETR
jgi:cell division protein FtsB